MPAVQRLHARRRARVRRRRMNHSSRSFSRPFAAERPACHRRRKVCARLRDPNHLRGQGLLSTFHCSAALPKTRSGGAVLLVLYTRTHLQGMFCSTEGARGVISTPEQVGEGKFRPCMLTWLMLQHQRFSQHLQLGMFRTFVFP